MGAGREGGIQWACLKWTHALRFEWLLLISYEKLTMSHLNTWKDKDQVVVKQEKVYKRFSFRTILHQLLDFLLVNKGLLFTIKQLTIEPGTSLRGYLQTDRERFTGAAKYFILTVGLFYYGVFIFQTP